MPTLVVVKLALAALLLVHGLIHALGFVKAYALAEVAALHQPIGRALGLVWLGAGLSFVASAALLFVAPRAWAPVTAIAVLVSQAVVCTAWSDAKFGTLANAIVLLPLVVAFATLRPSSLHSTYAREIAEPPADIETAGPITEADLADLPSLLQVHLRRVGVVGTPRPRGMHVQFRGEIRSSPDSGWMPFTADQHTRFDPPSRRFLMDASKLGVPFTALHRYVGDAATMQVRVAELFEVVDARGPQMNQSETVTMLNDLCLLAPAALLDADIRWRELDEGRLEATFTHAGNTVRAVLEFDAAGDLVGFVSDDRFLSADGQRFESLPWSTPILEHRELAGVRVAARAKAEWLRPEGPLEYGRFELTSLTYDE